jgi:Tfp pilus assembly protein FimT
MRESAVIAHSPRPAYTIFELIVVLAVLLLLAGIVIPSTSALYGNTRPQAAADVIRGEIASARAWASDEGQPYRVALSKDGTKIRRGPDGDFAASGAVKMPTPSARSVEYALEHATATVSSSDPNSPPQTDANNWVTVAVFMPDGPCRDDGPPSTYVDITEKGYNVAGMRIEVRTITGRVRMVPVTTSGSKK